jgi:hypothetical protein
MNSMLGTTTAGLLAATLACACSSGGGGGGGDGGLGGTCPLTLTNDQLPFNAAACQALTASDFAPYGVTIAQQMMSFPSVCHYYLMYASGTATSQTEIDVSFNPACQYDADYAHTSRDYQANLMDGGTIVTKFEDVPSLGEAAFYYYGGADFLRVKYKQVELDMGGALCHSTTKDCYDDTPETKATLIALAGVILAKF